MKEMKLTLTDEEVKHMDRFLTDNVKASVLEVNVLERQQLMLDSLVEKETIGSKTNNIEAQKKLDARLLANKQRGVVVGKLFVALYPDNKVYVKALKYFQEYLTQSVKPNFHNLLNQILRKEERMSYSKKSNPDYRKTLEKAMIMNFDEEMLVYCDDTHDRDRVVYYLSSERWLMEQESQFIDVRPVFAKEIREGKQVVVISIKKTRRPSTIMSKHIVSSQDVKNMLNDGLSVKDVEAVIGRDLTKEEKK